MRVESMANNTRPTDANLYVKNFGKDIDESKLCQLFSVYGTITSCKVQADSNGQSKGFGFVNFERPEMAKNALEKLNGYRLEDGKNLYVAPFQRKSDRQNELRRMHQENRNLRTNNLCLYVSNLDIMVDEKLLEAIFAKFGNVTSTHIMRNGSQSKGIGFVSFSTVEETTRALNEMNGKWILSKPIYVKLSSNNDNPTVIPSITPTYRAATPVLYPNIPTMFYVPTIVFPHPENQPPLPIGRSSALLRSSTTQTTRPPYPYNRVESDD